MADDRLACCLPASMLVSSCDTVSCRSSAISCTAFQNSLVLCPPRFIPPQLQRRYCIAMPYDGTADDCQQPCTALGPLADRSVSAPTRRTYTTGRDLPSAPFWDAGAPMTH